jgi:hypothetical protein
VLEKGVSAPGRRTIFTVPALAAGNPNPPLYVYNRRNIGFFTPPDIDRRVTSQGSIFSIRYNPTIPVVPEPKFLVPAGKKEILLHDLRRLGVTYGSLFPDMSGIATALNEEVEDWDPRLR